MPGLIHVGRASKKTSNCYARNMKTIVNTFDSRMTAWIQSWPAWMYRPMLAITNGGQPLTIILFASGLMVWSVWNHQTPMVVACGVVLATVIVSTVLKLVLRRTRPETDYVANMFYQTFSFPSGHAAAATVGFGFIAYLAFAGLTLPWSLILGALAIVFGLLVCVSRVYLGAHFPSDVVGGMLLGLVGISIVVFGVRPMV